MQFQIIKRAGSWVENTVSLKPAKALIEEVK